MNSAGGKYAEGSNRSAAIIDGPPEIEVRIPTTCSIQ